MRTATLKLWDLTSGKELRTLNGHRFAVNSVAIAPDGRTAVSGSDDGTLVRWELSTGKALSHLCRTLRLDSDCCRRFPGRPHRALRRWRWTLRLWNLESGSELRTFTGHSEMVRSIAIAADGRTALSGSADKTLKLWDLADGKELRILTGHSDWVRTVAIAPDGRTALSGSGDKTLKLWDLATGKELASYNAAVDWMRASRSRRTAEPRSRGVPTRR